MDIIDDKICAETYLLYSRYAGAVKNSLNNDVSVNFKAWHFISKHLLTLRLFALILQGALLIIVLLESYVFLLLRRNAKSGVLPTFHENWLIIGTGGAEFLLGATVSWWGRGARQYTLCGWLGVTAVCSLMVLACPYPEAYTPSVELCGGGVISTYKQSSMAPDYPSLTARSVFLVLTAVLCSLSKICIWAHGLTYLDDHEPEHGPYFYGILISIQLSVGLNGQNWLRNISLGENWWHAQIPLSVITLVFAILFFLFPRRLPNCKNYEATEYNCVIHPIGRMLCKKAVLAQSVGLALMNAAIFGYVRYDYAFIQTKFQVETLRQDPRTARTIDDVFRSLVIIFLVSVFRVRFSVRRTDGVKATTASKVGAGTAVFVAMLFAVLSGLKCDVGEVTGLREEYRPPLCSRSCGCGSERYGFSPVCVLDTSQTYFSPCHAGCKGYEDLNGYLLFNNCTCGGRAVRGSCDVQTCGLTYSIYLVLYTLVLAVTAASLLMQGMVILRSVRIRDKPIAMGVSLAVVGLLSHILGHVIYMMINYWTCAYQADGVCLLHHQSQWSMGSVSAALALLSSAASLMAYRFAEQTHIVAGGS